MKRTPEELQGSEDTKRYDLKTSKSMTLDIFSLLSIQHLINMRKGRVVQVVSSNVEGRQSARALRIEKASFGCSIGRHCVRKYSDTCV
jgi:hypothetical protein